VVEAALRRLDGVTHVVPESSRVLDGVTCGPRVKQGALFWAQGLSFPWLTSWL
jgi:hypothetical protein